MTLIFILQDTNPSNFWVLNWYYIVAVLLSFIGVIFGIKNYLKKNKLIEKNSPIEVSPTINPINNVTVNVGSTDFSERQEQKKSNDEGYDKLKKLTHILFIDDDTKFKVVQILINTGWINTESITDLNTYDEAILLKSQIVFVDVQGVGVHLACKDEGMSLALNIKNKYPKKKVVIYSAIQTHKVFHEAVTKVDFLLSKDAEPYEFISLIEKYSKEIDL